MFSESQVTEKRSFLFQPKLVDNGIKKKVRHKYDQNGKQNQEQDNLLKPGNMENMEKLDNNMDLDKSISNDSDEEKGHVSVETPLDETLERIREEHINRRLKRDKK